VNSMHLLMGKIGRPECAPMQFAGQPSSMNTREIGADGAYPAYLKLGRPTAHAGACQTMEDWLQDPHSIWYQRTSGIWQTVWLERVSSTYIDCLRWAPNLGRWEIGLEAWLGGDRREGRRLHVKMHGRPLRFCARRRIGRAIRTRLGRRRFADGDHLRRHSEQQQ